MLKLVSSTIVKRDGKFVVQKYIERPLLVYNTKFDIRQWFLVTDWNPLTVWFYRDSYIRFCSQQYTLDDFDEAIHLSNNAIQKNKKNGPRSCKLPIDNMWTHEEFQDYLRTRGQSDLWETLIYPGMKRALTCALLVTQDLIEYRKSSFELYGADFMLTEDCQPLLIEINSSPSMESSTAITARLCTNVLEDTMKVCIDRRFDRNCDIGRFELSFKQPLVAVPPYIGINLSIDGQAIRKPQTNGSIPRKTDVPSTGDPYLTPRSSVRLTMHSETKKVATISNSGSVGAIPTTGKSNSDSRNTGKQSSTSSYKTVAPYIKTGLKPDTGSSSVKSTSNWEFHKVGVSESYPSVKGPQPPSKASPHLSVLHSRRIVSRTSVSNNYTVPLTVADRQGNKAVVSVNNVESTDIRTMRPGGSVKGNIGSITDAWGRTCYKCGNGRNLHLDSFDNNCRCRQDSVYTSMDFSKPTQSKTDFATRQSEFTSRSEISPQRLSVNQDWRQMRPITAFNWVNSTRNRLYAAALNCPTADKIFFKYPDGCSRPNTTFSGRLNPMPKFVRRYISRRMEQFRNTNNKMMYGSAVYMDTSQRENPLSILPQNYHKYSK